VVFINDAEKGTLLPPYGIKIPFPLLAGHHPVAGGWLLNTVYLKLMANGKEEPRAFSKAKTLIWIPLIQGGN
jgi:hypothetical protein